MSIIIFTSFSVHVHKNYFNDNHIMFGLNIDAMWFLYKSGIEDNL